MYKFFVTFLVVFLSLYFHNEALADVEYGMYMDLTLSNGVTSRFYFNTNMADETFSFDKDKKIPVNMTGSTITGYQLNSDGSTYATLQFRSFGQKLQYRCSVSGSQTQYVTVTSMQDYEGIVFFGHKDIWYWVTIVCVLFMLFLIFIRRK